MTLPPGDAPISNYKGMKRRKSMEQNFPDNTLYEMDNLEVLRGMNSETVDLIATDPPFNTKRNRSGTAGFYEDRWKWGDKRTPPDQWKWNEVHPIWLESIKDDNPALSQAIEAARVTHADDTAAFLCFLSVRLLEMHRILKDTGSIYLHCDHTANAYIRMCMDAIFGKNNFRNEIIWERASSRAKGCQHPSKAFGKDTDTIFYYSKSKSATHNVITRPLTETEMEEKFPDIDEKGRRYNTEVPIFRAPSMGERPNLCYEYKGFRNPHPSGWRVSRDNLKAMDEAGDIIWREGKSPLRKSYADDYDGKPIGTLWINIPIAGGKERTGSPDQKPLKLYKRIIKAGSNEGDLVLDPFCGCATTIIAARNLNRRWVGIDRRLDAKYHVVCRIAGINKKERERLESQPDFADWVQNQMAKYEAHYRSDAPERTDNGEPAAPTLEQVIPVAEEYALEHKEMHKILVEQFGLKCWGCSFKPPDERYLELDHIDPRSSGGSNQLDNRALLCRPCNQKKSNRLTLDGLWRENRRNGYLRPREKPIGIQIARDWARQHMAKLIRDTPHQQNLYGR